ncbi:MAG: isocitrate lyase [Anaerolineae bacterium]|nr:isocitrate lyase [Anaerolineae bacterium]
MTGQDKRQQQAAELAREWGTNPRWQGIERPYTAEEVLRLRGSIRIEYTLARMGATKLWEMLHTEPYINSLGAVTGNQAVQMVDAGLRAIYVSGWQTAADANTSAQTYPDQSLYPVNSVPALCRRINNALMRADQTQHMNGSDETDYFVPLVADAEAGFGGNLNAYELTRDMIDGGAAGIHFEDQLSSAKKCGHLGGKVLVPTREAIAKLVAARLAADVMDVPTLIIARTDADAATLITSDIDERDRPFVMGERTYEGFFGVRHGMPAAIARGLSYAPYCDMIWMETSHPDLEEARTFAEAIHKQYPGKMLMYNCSPSFNWKRHLDDSTIAKFQRELGAMGYKFQFITLAGFHAINLTMFELAREYAEIGMPAYSTLQEREFDEEAKFGYRAVKHQSFVGTGYFDLVQQTVMGGMASTTALTGSTEAEQFTEETPHVHHDPHHHP